MGNFKDVCNQLRAKIEELKVEVLALKGQAGNNGEAIANVVLSYRHLEDARMRLGKAIQADGDGVSIYDKPQGA